MSRPIGWSYCGPPLNADATEAMKRLVEGAFDVEPGGTGRFVTCRNCSGRGFNFSGSTPYECKPCGGSGRVEVRR